MAVVTRKKTDSFSSGLLHNNGGTDSSDEAYTLAYGVKPIIKYIPKNLVVWSPFTTIDGEFYKQLTANGNKVIVSHIKDGKDFFSWEPKEHWDIIVGNPPFKNKRLFFERALSFNKPIALIMTLAWLNDSGSKLVFMKDNKQLQLLLFDKRMKFSNPFGKPNNKITFSSGYYCYNLLPKDLILETLEIPKK